VLTKTSATNYAAAWQTPVGLPYSYNYVTTLGTPTSGQIRLDNANPENATMMRVHGITSTGVNILNELTSKCVQGNFVTLRTSATAYCTYAVTQTNTVGTSYIEFTVTLWGTGATDPVAGAVTLEILPGIPIPQLIPDGQFLKGVFSMPQWAAITPADVGLPKVTTSVISAGPPSSPANGDIWYASLGDAAGTRWAFQYNAGSSSAYKWECIGGAPVNIDASSGGSNITSVFPTFNYSFGPSYNTPRPGDYAVSIYANGSNNAVPNNGPMISLGSNGAYSDQFIAYATGQQAGGYQPLAKSGVANGQASGAVLQIVYCSYPGGTSTFDRCTLTVLPRRIS
jgi:hypothetical protein